MAAPPVKPELASLTVGTLARLLTAIGRYSHYPGAIDIGVGVSGVSRPTDVWACTVPKSKLRGLVYAAAPTCVTAKKANNVTYYSFAKSV